MGAAWPGSGGLRLDPSSAPGPAPHPLRRQGTPSRRHKFFSCLGRCERASKWTHAHASFLAGRDLPGRWSQADPRWSPPQSQPHLGGPQALRGLACSGHPRPVSGSPPWQDRPQMAHLEGGCRRHHLPPRGPRVFSGVPVPGYDSEWSPGGREGTPRGGHCSESLHALLLQGGRARVLGCQPRLVVNQPLSKSPQSSGLWTCVTCGHNNAWSHVVLPPGVTLTSPP